MVCKFWLFMNVSRGNITSGETTLAVDLPIWKSWSSFFKGWLKNLLNILNVHLEIFPSSKRQQDWFHFPLLSPLLYCSSVDTCYSTKDVGGIQHHLETKADHKTLGICSWGINDIFRWAPPTSIFGFSGVGARLHLWSHIRNFLRSIWPRQWI